MLVIGKYQHVENIDTHVRVEFSIWFKNINVHSKATHQKLINWSQIVERANNVSLLVDIKFVRNAISCYNVH